MTGLWEENITEDSIKISHVTVPLNFLMMILIYFCYQKCICIKHRSGSRTAATSKMESFVIIVNGWKPLNIITKRSILHVVVVSDYAHTAEMSSLIFEFIENNIQISWVFQKLECLISRAKCQQLIVSRDFLCIYSAKQIENHGILVWSFNIEELCI